MNSKYDDLDLYEDYEVRYDPIVSDRKARRKRRPEVHHVAKKTAAEQIAESAQTVGLEGGFEISYKPARHEAAWLMQSLQEFYQQELISDVQALLKGGKEANVYRCAAHPATGETWLAAKVYRPQMFRNLRNDHRYRQGRTMLAPNGRPLRPRDERMQRAVAAKTTFGRQVAHTSWLMHEYATLELLYEAGGAVPRPFASAENAILMTYIGDEQLAAPALNEMSLEPREARPLFERVMANIDLMLAYGRVHGDLSAYNILYWNGEVTLIDFPQVVYSSASKQTGHPLDSASNPDAYDIFARDIERVCDYFQRQGVNVDAGRLSERLWSRHVAEHGEQDLADASRRLDVWD